MDITALNIEMMNLMFLTLLIVFLFLVVYKMTSFLQDPKNEGFTKVMDRKKYVFAYFFLYILSIPLFIVGSEISFINSLFLFLYAVALVLINLWIGIMRMVYIGYSRQIIYILGSLLFITPITMAIQLFLLFPDRKENR